MIGITLENVSKRFGTTLAVDRVSLEIRSGELFFLLGPSGCGKTTILRLLAGFDSPDAGEIRFDGRNVNRLPAHKRNTSLVFQNYALWPHLNVAENVAYGLRERRVRTARRRELVEQALERVRMAAYAQRLPNQLSGGQQQRVALARALVVEPDAVLLDEPLSNLDARLRLQMRDEIRRVHAETGITMVYVTHDQKECLSMAERMAVMSTGRVEQVGAPRHLYRRPETAFVAEFLGEINVFPGTVAAHGAGSVTVRTRVGTFAATAEEPQPATGTAALCMVRPEALRIGDAAPNRLRARVTGSVYLGEVEELQLDADGTDLRLLRLNPAALPPERNATVTASFAVEDTIVLPAPARVEPTESEPGTAAANASAEGGDLP